MVALERQVAVEPPVLELRGLSKSYGATEVLRALDLAMAAGEFLVLVGPSGCGKSTLLNCIAGLDESSGGEIRIGGRDVTKVPPRDRDIAMVFQSYALYPTMTVAQNIGFGMRVRRMARNEQQRRIAEVAKLLQIEPLLGRKPGALSGGQRQRVAMGRALVREPVLFLFDEPLSNLDAKLRVELRGEIKRLHQRLNASIVYVTHDQVEAMTLGTRIVVLDQGTIQQIGTPTEIYERPANLFVADFMGSPPMNLVPARFSTQGGVGCIRFGDSSQQLRLPVTPDALLKRYVAGGGAAAEVVVGLRPEALLPEAGPHSLRLRAESVENAGSDTFATFRLGNATITARLPGRMRLTAGEEISLGIDPDTLSFFDPASGLRLG